MFTDFVQVKEEAPRGERSCSVTTLTGIPDEMQFLRKSSLSSFTQSLESSSISSLEDFLEELPVTDLCSTEL